MVILEELWKLSLYMNSAFVFSAAEEPYGANELPFLASINICRRKEKLATRHDRQGDGIGFTYPLSTLSNSLHQPRQCAIPGAP